MRISFMARGAFGADCATSALERNAVRESSGMIGAHRQEQGLSNSALSRSAPYLISTALVREPEKCRIVYLAVYPPDQAMEARYRGDHEAYHRK
jgi:hypothetical protein